MLSYYGRENLNVVTQFYRRTEGRSFFNNHRTSFGGKIEDLVLKERWVT